MGGLGQGFWARPCGIGRLGGASALAEPLASFLGGAFFGGCSGGFTRGNHAASGLDTAMRKSKGFQLVGGLSQSVARRGGLFRSKAETQKLMKGIQFELFQNSAAADGNQRKSTEFQRELTSAATVCKKLSFLSF